jgi:hypothetical protein
MLRPVLCLVTLLCCLSPAAAQREPAERGRADERREILDRVRERIHAVEQRLQRLEHSAQQRRRTDQRTDQRADRLDREPRGRRQRPAADEREGKRPQGRGTLRERPHVRRLLALRRERVERGRMGPVLQRMRELRGEHRGREGMRAAIRKRLLQGPRGDRRQQVRRAHPGAHGGQHGRRVIA